MKDSLQRLITGYAAFKEKYAAGDESIMQRLADRGQKPSYMVVGCCDSRVDPSLIFQTAPGDIFIARNVANIVPPYEADENHHGTSAALEFGICFLEVKHLIILGHSRCGGIEALMNNAAMEHNDFISQWVSLITLEKDNLTEEAATKTALLQSYNNCKTFPWIQERLENQTLSIHLWYFDIESAQLEAYDFGAKEFVRSLV